ncbi:hypothetical protein UFOVP1433_11 [uncultured Caudovirales phage]|uniref:Uncharacterized protein n=1 Tax=uncultured Caudovirales phage TaxID=2100421 RepID=A0A6J5QNK4_9CAUD|nr:hypothetical protein UFOVP553_11 [uncultured Caudovirales phage]CAB4182588.1 hypothetical protein UFOVP1081_11 [uncultured Caudovirales phage]CAB4212606.1 hypothetical protein UFOVP1433_11 [uncultured Caudovirales phage]
MSETLISKPAVNTRAQTVRIACKAPNGLVLNLSAYHQTNDRGDVRVKPGPTVTLAGWSRVFGAADHTTGGYAMTDVPLDFWNAWYAANEHSSLLADKIILPPHKDTAGMVREFANVPQMFRPARDGDVAGVKIEKDDQ